jgi:hypothetical protein
MDDCPCQLHYKRKCVTLWPCHLHLKVSKGKRISMEIQIFHHAIIYSSKKNPWKEPKIVQDILTL